MPVLSNLIPAFGPHNNQESFKIELDEEQVVIHGKPLEAPSVQVKGRVVLCTKAKTKIRRVTITMFGAYYVCLRERKWSSETAAAAGKFHMQEETIYRAANEQDLEEWKSNRYEWPFTLRIDSSDVETFHGKDMYYKWHLVACVERPTHIMNHHATRPFQVIRTYDSTSPAFSQRQTINHSWPNKIKYVFTIPSTAVVFGSVIPVEIFLSPLLLDLKIKSIKTSLIEVNKWNFRDVLIPKFTQPIYSAESVVLTEMYRVPENIKPEVVDGEEGYKFALQIQTPKNLRDCRLTLNPTDPESQRHAAIFSIKHYLQFEVFLVDPGDGHLSVLKLKFNIILFRTPNQAFNNQFQLVNRGVVPVVSDPDANTFYSPPLYGQHMSDETLDARDPANSGLTTPTSIHTSRGSTTNLEELYNQDSSPLNDLATRLNNIANITAAGSRSSTTREAQEPGWQAPTHLEYDDEALARVPSYNTAAPQTAPPPESYAGLPSYDETNRNTS